MSTKQSTVDFLVDQLAGVHSVRTRKMFGEYALYVEEKVVALICDDQLFVKITPGSESYLDASNEAPPYPGAKNYLLVPGERWEDTEWLRAFIEHTTAAVPPPKPKKGK